MNRTDVIFNLIQNNPGIYTRELIKESGLSNGVVQYHLAKLERQNKIRSYKGTRYKRFYASDVLEDEFPIISNFRKSSKKDVLLAILISPTPDFTNIMKLIRKSPSTTSWNISGLIKDGVIEKVRLNGKTLYKVKDKELLRKTLEKEFSKIVKDTVHHEEDIFLAL